jgi:hypothetical protein
VLIDGSLVPKPDAWESAGSHQSGRGGTGTLASDASGVYSNLPATSRDDPPPLVYSLFNNDAAVAAAAASEQPVSEYVTLNV